MKLEDVMPYENKRVKITVEYWGVLERADYGHEIMLTGGRYPARGGVTRYIRRDDISRIDSCEIVKSSQE